MVTSVQEISLIIRDRIFEEIAFSREMEYARDLSIEKRVHEIRKSIKRTRSLLRLLKSSLPRRTYLMLDGQMSQAGKNLSEMRDATVNLQTFSFLTNNFGYQLPDSLIRKVSAGLLLRHTSLNAGTCKFAATNSLLTQVEDQLREHGSEKLEVMDLTHVLDQSFIKAFESYQIAHLAPETQVLHAWRKRTKYFYLQFKLTADLFNDKKESFQQQLDDLTDLLGKDHDLFNLERVINDDFDLDKEEKKMINSILYRQRAKCKQEAFNIARRLFTMENVRGFGISCIS